MEHVLRVNMECLQKDIKHDQSEDELTSVAGAVKTVEFEPCPDGDKDVFCLVGVIFLERMDPCLLASGWE